MAADLGIRLQAVRSVYGWSQRELAKRAGVPHSAISLIEHDNVSPSMASLEKILAGFEIAVSDFFSLKLTRAVSIDAEADTDPEHCSKDLARSSSNNGVTLEYHKDSTESQLVHMVSNGIVLIVEGEAVLHYLGGERHLQAGDRVSFDGSNLFKLEAKAAVLSWVFVKIP